MCFIAAFILFYCIQNHTIKSIIYIDIVFVVYVSIIFTAVILMIN